MKSIVLFILFVLCVAHNSLKSQSASKDKYYIRFKYCEPRTNKTNLGLDSLFLLDGFHPEYLETTTRKYKVYDYQENQIENCTVYQLLLKPKTYNFFYVNLNTFDTLFLNINLVKDTLIDLNQLADNYYKKISIKEPLLKDINTGDKISITYSYSDCPQYGSFFNITFIALNKTAFNILNDRKIVGGKFPKNAKIKLEDILRFEEKVRNLQTGYGLEIQIKKNNFYQVFKCQLTYLPNSLFYAKKQKPRLLLD